MCGRATLLRRQPQIILATPFLKVRHSVSTLYYWATVAVPDIAYTMLRKLLILALHTRHHPYSLTQFRQYWIGCSIQTVSLTGLLQ